MVLNCQQKLPQQLFRGNLAYGTATNLQGKDMAVQQLNPAIAQAQTATVQPNAAQPAAVQPGGQMNTLGANVAAPNNNAAPPAKGGKELSKEEGKQVLQRLSEQYGVDFGKRGNTKDWAKVAAAEDGVNVFDGDKQVDGQVDSVSEKTVVLNDKETGEQFRVQVGGDGELNGGDDTVFALGGQTGALNGQAGAGNALMGQPADGQNIAGTPNTAYGGGVAATPTAGEQMGGLQTNQLGGPLQNPANCTGCRGGGCPLCRPAGGAAGGAVNQMDNLMLQMQLNQAQQNVAEHENQVAKQTAAGNELNTLTGQDGIGKAAEVQGIDIAPATNAAQNPLNFSMAEINNLIALIQGIGMGSLR